ncbi:hypothetical protein LguiB_018497 [Lonicera macranthoides]
MVVYFNLLALVCWAIWKARNDYFFNDREVPPSLVVKNMESMMREIKDSSHLHTSADQGSSLADPFPVQVKLVSLFIVMLLFSVHTQVRVLVAFWLMVQENYVMSLAEKCWLPWH